MIRSLFLFYLFGGREDERTYLVDATELEVTSEVLFVKSLHARIE